MTSERSRDARRLLAGFAAYGVGDFLLFGLSYFVLIPTLTHYLSPEEYGIVATTTSISVLLVGVLQFGLPSAVFRLYFLRQTAEARRAYFGSTCLFGLIVAATLSAGLTIFGGSVWDSLVRNAPFRVYGTYIIWGAFFQIIIVFRSILLRAQERPRLYVAFDVAQFVCLVVLVVYHVVVLRQGTLGQVRAAFLTYALFAGVSVLLIARNTSLHPNRTDIADSLRFGLPVFLTYFIGFFESRVNVVILQFFVAGGAVGLFALGQQLGNLVYLISVAFEKAWQPYFYGQSPERARKLISRFMAAATMGYVTLAVGLGVFAPEITRVLSSNAYAGTWIIVAISSFGAAMVAIGSAPNGALYYARRSDVTMWIALAGAMVNVTLCLLLAPTLMALGAAYAGFISSFVILALNLWAMQRYFYVRLEYVRLAGILAMGIAVVVAVSLVCNEATSLPFGAIMAVKTIALVVFVASVWLARLFPPRDDPGFFQQIASLVYSLKSRKDI
jgi:O-antigen/teichoic acid export membrane protein